MQRLTLEQLSDHLETMQIEQSIDSGFAITHHGRLNTGEKAIAISDCNGGAYLLTAQ